MNVLQVMERNISNIEYINLSMITLDRFAYQRTFLGLRIFSNAFINIFFYFRYKILFEYFIRED